jgi:ribonuclease Z
MRLITLGTGSGRPTLKRNVSAVAVSWEGEWVLFDCGEGTQTQILRAGLKTSKLSAIFITHLHGDHFNGLPGLLSSMGLDGRERALALAGPPGMKDYLNLLTRLKVLGVSYPLEVRELASQSFKQRAAARRQTAEKRSRDTSTQDQTQALSGAAVVYETEKFEVRALPLNHRIFDLGYRIDERPRPGRFDLERAYALGIPEGPLFGQLQRGQSIRLDDGRLIDPTEVVGPERPGKSMAYCTDTRPCAEDVDLAGGVDLLLHEATFAQDLVDEAKEYGHSTSAQAGQVAAAAGARRLVITHISSRYSDATQLLDQAQAVYENTTLADDLMDLEV